MRVPASCEVGPKEAEEFLDYFFGLLTSGKASKFLLAILLFGVAVGCVRMLYEEAVPIPPETT